MVTGVFVLAAPPVDAKGDANAACVSSGPYTVCGSLHDWSHLSEFRDTAPVAQASSWGDAPSAWLAPDDSSESDSGAAIRFLDWLAGLRPYGILTALDAPKYDDAEADDEGDDDEDPDEEEDEGGEDDDSDDEQGSGKDEDDDEVDDDEDSDEEEDEGGKDEESEDDEGEDEGESGEGGEDVDEGDDEDSEEGDEGEDEPTVDVCHVPPGNPENAHDITVGLSSLEAHLAHGDHLGACTEDDDGDDEGDDEGDGGEGDDGGGGDEGSDDDEGDDEGDGGSDDEDGDDGGGSGDEGSGDEGEEGDEGDVGGSEDGGGEESDEGSEEGGGEGSAGDGPGGDSGDDVEVPGDGSDGGSQGDGDIGGLPPGYTPIGFNLAAGGGSSASGAAPETAPEHGATEDQPGPGSGGDGGGETHPAAPSSPLGVLGLPACGAAGAPGLGPCAAPWADPAPTWAPPGTYTAYSPAAPLGGSSPPSYRLREVFVHGWLAFVVPLVD